MVSARKGNDNVDSMTYEAPQAIRQMLFTTWALLGSFSTDQRAQAVFPMDDPRRVDWDFIPKPDRCGVPLFDMNRHQRTTALTLLKTALSIRGYSQALAIMATENVLRELEVIDRRLGVIAGEFRDPDGYWFSFFGRPAFEDTWGWRIIGHHLSVSCTVVAQRQLMVTPLAMGAQPVPAGVLDPLGETERTAFRLIRGLSSQLRAKAIIHDVAPADFVTRQVPRVGAEEWPDHVDLGIPNYTINDSDRRALRFVRADPSGLDGASLDDTQLDLARELLLQFVLTGPDELGAQYRAALAAVPPDRIHFAWAGGTDPQRPHYYRISTPSLLIESDNAVAAGNHMHTIWRDLDNDLGHDALVAHYQQYGHGGQHLDRRTRSTRPSELEDVPISRGI